MAGDRRAGRRVHRLGSSRLRSRRRELSEAGAHPSPPRFSRTFWLANAAILIDEVLYLALIPLLPGYAERFDLSRAETGFLYAAYPLLLFCAAIPAGMLADRLGTRAVLVWGCAALVAATVGFAFAAAAWQLWTMRALQGITAGFVATAGMANIAMSASAARRGTTIGLAIAIQGLSALAGYALGGFVSPAIGTRAMFLLVAGLGAAIVAALVLDRAAPVATTRRPAFGVILRDALSSTAVRASVAAILVVGMIGSSLQTIVSLELSGLGFSVSELGTVLVVAGAVGFAATPVAGWLADRFGVARALTTWAVATPLVVLLLAIPGEPAWVIAALLAATLPLARIGGSLAYTRGAEHARVGEGLAVGYGMALAAWSLGAGVGPVVAGGIADAAGYAPAYLAIAAVALLFVYPASRREARTEEAT